MKEFQLVTRINYEDIKSGQVNQADIDKIKRVGTVIITGGVPQDVRSGPFLFYSWQFTPDPRKPLAGNNKSGIMPRLMLAVSKVYPTPTTSYLMA